MTEIIHNIHRTCFATQATGSCWRIKQTAADRQLTQTPKAKTVGGFEVISPAPQDVWAEVFSRDAAATAFQSPEWMQAATATGQYVDASRLFMTRYGRVVLPLAARRSFPGFVSAASMPHGLGAGGLVSEFALSAEVIRDIVDHLRSLPYARLAVRPNPLQSDIWRAADPAQWQAVSRKTHVIDLTGGYETVWSKRFHSIKRNRIRKARRSGLVIERGNTAEFIQRFYQLYLLWSENKSRGSRIPVALARWLAAKREPLWKFENTAKHMGQCLQTYVASIDGRPAAAAVFLKIGKSGVYWRGASDAQLLKKYPGNDLLQNEMIKDACEADCVSYHMGESGGVQSLEKFKEGFGATAYQYEEFLSDRLPFLPTLSGINAFASRVVTTLVRGA